jgi:hypothetical protein
MVDGADDIINLNGDVTNLTESDLPEFLNQSEAKTVKTDKLIFKQGELGVKYNGASEDKDFLKLRDVLLAVCPQLTSEYVSQHIKKTSAYAERYFDYSKIAKKILIGMSL